MRHKLLSLILISTAALLLLSSCQTQPTPDVAAISTAAAQTVEARFTALAKDFTPTPQPATETPVPAPSDTPKPKPTATLDNKVGSNGKPCYVMTFLGDITIPDGMIIAPGKQFTKTWRVRNDGNCVWDSNYALVLNDGDAMSSVTRFPLTRTVNPGDSYDFSIELIAPTTEDNYAGFWKVATPYGGFMGVANTNQSLSVKINVSTNPEKSFGSVNVAYDWTRRPSHGCSQKGAAYDFSATITANGPGEIRYRWDRNPDDGSRVGGVLKFDAAGSKTVYWTWNMTMDSIQGIDRWVGITTTVDSKETTFNRVMFNFTCGN